MPLGTGARLSTYRTFILAPSPFGGCGLLCILRNREDALLPLIIRLVALPKVAFSYSGAGDLLTSPAPLLLTATLGRVTNPIVGQR